MSKKDKPTGTRPWMEGHKRYSVNVQNGDDLTRYVEFMETESLEKAKNEAVARGDKDCRSALVFDRLLQMVIFRFPDKPIAKPTTPPPPPRKRRRGRRIEL